LNISKNWPNQTAMLFLRQQ